MTTSGFHSLGRCLRVGLLMLGLSAIQIQSYAENVKAELLLVWGSNGEKPSDPAHKPLDEDLAKELRKAFKWQNYFVINRTNTTLLPQVSKKVEMSKKCVIEIKALDGQRVEAQLFGEGKPRDKVIKPLSKEKSITFGGEDSNKCAWFVIIRRIE